MTESTNSREATATIRGYIYQFDSTILKILLSGDDDSCTIEDVEDFDIHSGDLSSYFQCKYYAAQKLTSSVLRDAILPMLKNFIALQADKRVNKRYCLYGYFKESSFESSDISIDTLKSVLTRKEKSSQGSDESAYKTINIQDEIGATDNDLKDFSRILSLELCSAEYEEHKEAVITELAKIFNTSQYEASSYIYPTALSAVSSLACKSDVADRTVTKRSFLQKIKPSLTLYSLWYLRERGHKAYCKEMKSWHFSERNVEAKARFFILELPDGTSNSEIKDILLSIRKNWSSHQSKRKPDKERYAPYLFLRKTSQEQLASLKNTLFQEGFIFLDGYPFQGSSFYISSINQQQTSNNRISMRILNNENDLRNCIENLQENRCIYQFFKESPLEIEGDISQVCIPIASARMISSIV